MKKLYISRYILGDFYPIFYYMVMSYRSSLFYLFFSNETLWPIENRLSFFPCQKKLCLFILIFLSLSWKNYQNEVGQACVCKDDLFYICSLLFQYFLFVDTFFISTHKMLLKCSKSLCGHKLLLFLKTYLLTFETQLQKSEVKRVDSDSMSEWERRLEKPSVPLTAKGPPGPPKIVEIEKKYSAIEG